MLRKLWYSSILYKKVNGFIQAKFLGFMKSYESELIHKLHNEIESVLNSLNIEKLVKDVEGVKVNCYLDSILSRSIFWGNFEKDEIKFIKKFLKSDDTFIDIGANIGLYSLIAAKCLEKGTVYSFEPSSQTNLRLIENIGINSLTNISVHQKALSDVVDFAELNIVDPEHEAWNSLAKPSFGKISRRELVQTITLDAFVISLESIDSISLIKIDVEGWELPVIKGGESFLSNASAPTLIIEFTDDNAESAGFSCRALYELLLSYNYKMFIYDAQNNILCPDPLRDRYPYLNLIATKNDALVNKRLQG